MDHGVTWDVKVDRSGNVTVIPSQIDDSISSFKDGVLTVKNEPISNGKFKIKKVDQDGKPLSNAGFTLYKSDKSTVVRSKNSREAEYFTDENGNLYYSNIPDGIYYLKETTPPKGYTRASTSEWTSISIRNSNVNIIDGDITPDKIDQYVRFGNADEKVSVKSIDGKESSLEVDKNGNVNISTLADGDYELSQNNNKITVHIKDGKLTRSYQGGFVTNNPDQPSTNDQSLVKVSADLTQALVRYPNDNKSNAYPSGGYIDISRWANGIYKIEDEIAKELITIEVIDGKLAKSPIRSDLYETVTTRNWKSDLDYQRDANYPDYMNMKDYVELTDYDSGELTSYILLKPDNKIPGGNGTDKNTIFNIMASNANIKSVEIFDIGGDYYKAGPNASMDDQSMGSYINDYNMQGTNETRDRKDKTYITIDGQRRGSVYNTYSNSVKISIPASRFGEDWSYLIRVKSNIYNKDYGSTISHHWVTDNDTLGEAYLKKDFDVPAYKDLTETRKVATIIQDSKNLASNFINNIKDELLGSLVQTAYAAETSDFSKVEISHTPNGASDYIEYTVVNVIDNVDVSFTKYSICKDSNGEDYTQILPGAEFKLQILKDNEFVDTGKTARSDSSGQVKFEGLTAGEYQLIETTVPDGYRNPGGPVKKFTVKMTENGLKAFVNGTEELIYSGNNANNYIYNERKGKGELKVTKKGEKKGETSELLNGAEFTLYRFEFKDSGDSIATITTGKDGEKGVAHFTELPYGKYWLVETKSPDGYIRNPEPRLITISHKYYVPETAGKDVSSQLTLNRDSDHLPSIRSSSGSEYVVYPNSAEGLKANLNYKVDQNANIQPGDYFYASTSDNLDIGGIFDDNSFAKAGGLDIVGSQGTIAKAKVETIDGKSYIKYMFTDYVSNRRLNDINLYIPMFVDRYKVRNSTGNTSIPLPIPLEVGIAIPGQTQNKEKHVLSDNIHVDYEDIYRNQPSANMVNSYTISVDSNGRFRTVVYINQNQRYTWNKNITFSPNQNVKDLTYRVYQSNTRLPMSYGLNESELGNPINTFTKDALNAGYYDTIYIGPENQYNTNTYYVVIDGTIENTNFYEFRNRVTYNSYIDNCCNLETYRWENSTINCDLTYNPGNTTERTMPVEVTVPNSKNQVEYTKIEALPEEDAPKDGSQVTNNTDESINKIDGAKFELRKLDETTSKYEKVKGSDQESKDGGKLKWTGLNPGKYEVWETEAPRGYTKPQDPVSSFEVNENGEIINIKDNTTIIKNYKASLPSTGGAGTFIGFAIVGTAVMLAAIAYFGIYQNNKNRRRSNR